MQDRPPRAGKSRVRSVAAGTGLRWALPLVAVEAAVFVLLAWPGGLSVPVALAGFAVLAVATALAFWLAARNLDGLRRWIADQADETGGAPAAPRYPVFGDAVDGIAHAVHGILQARAERMDQLSAETGRMFDSLPDPLFMVSASRRVVRLNRAGRALFGEAKLGQDVSHLVRSPALEEAVDRALAGEQPDSVDITVTADQVERLFAVEVAAMPLAGNDGPVVMAMFHDITELRRTEQMRVDFVANASHEIRSPLATLIGCVETLQGPARDDEDARERFLAMMDDQGRRMARLVDDLLSLSRIELREHAQPTGTVDIGVLLERLRSSLTFQAEEKGMTIALEIAENLRPVRGEGGELEQALYNLLSNAIKYGRRDSEVAVAAGYTEQPPDNLRLVHGPLVWVSVTDHGEGIEARHIPRLTERFYRVDTARSREMGGTGLGLAIVKHVLSRHRGALQIASKVGEGSTFTVWLPVVTAD